MTGFVPSLLADRLRSAADTADGKPLICGWCTLGSAFAAETVARSGVDLVCLDAEHGLLGWDQALVVVQTLSAALIPVVVRVDSHEPAVIAKALDAGADGVIVPHVQSPEAAGAVAAACRYPPDGSRSWGPTRSSLLGVADTSSANHRVVCIAMLESVAAIERASEIAATPGIDAVLIGSNDLALDMLGPGDSPASVKESEAFERQLALAGAACREAGVVAGAPCLPSMNANRLQEMGFRLLVTPSDAALLRSAAEQAIADIGSERPTDRDLSVPTLGY